MEDTRNKIQDAFNNHFDDFLKIKAADENLRRFQITSISRREIIESGNTLINSIDAELQNSTLHYNEEQKKHLRIIQEKTRIIINAY